MSTYKSDRILVVLDLDENLIHATPNPKDDNWNFEVFGYKVYKRPGLNKFVAFLKTEFDVAIWSSASDDYVYEIVKHIFPKKYGLKFIWGRSKCVRRIDYEMLENYGYFDEDNHLNYIKPLKKVKKSFKIPLDRILIIDDTPEKCVDNYGNAIYTKEFTGDQGDNELEFLGQYLYNLRNVTHVRSIEKRGWRTIAE